MFSPSFLGNPLLLVDPWTFHMLLLQISLEISMLSPLPQRTYNNIRKIATGQGDGYITCYLPDYVCFKIILR